MQRRRKSKRGPTFLARELDYAEVRCHRHLDCGLYNACLGLVSARRWTSFSCRQCELFPDGAPSIPRGPAEVLPMPVGSIR